MSVPRPWPRRRPVAPLVLGTIGLLDVALALLGLVQHGSSALRWVTLALWLVVVVVSAVSWRRQGRRFDEETARLARSDDVGRDAPPGGPTAP